MSISLHNIHCWTHCESAERLLTVSAAGRRARIIAGLSLFPTYNAFILKTATCWLWTAVCDAYGYGQISVPGHSPMKAHRLAWMFRHGPIPSSVHVLHKCDTPACVNPDHLFLGDNAANNKDAASKGRLHVGRPNARKLTAEAEKEIRDAVYYLGLQNKLAAKYGVTKAYISMIRSGRRRLLAEGSRA